jgi:uncharacterized protein
MMLGVNSPYYQCQRCTNCCKWPGEVKLTEGDIARIAAYLKLSEPQFIETWTRLRPDRRGLALLNKGAGNLGDEGECIFLDGRDCRIQPVKPTQCAGFPNTWNFPGWREVCEAIPLEGESAES